MAKMETFLGRCTIDVARLPANEKKTLKLALRDVSSGTITVICEFIPLGVDHHQLQQQQQQLQQRKNSNGDDNADGEGECCDEADVLYDAMPEGLQNATLEGDDEQDHLLDEDEDHAGIWAWSSSAGLGVQTPIAHRSRIPSTASAALQYHTPSIHGARVGASVGDGARTGSFSLDRALSQRSQAAPSPHQHHGPHSHSVAAGALQVSGIRLRNLRVKTTGLFSGRSACFVQCALNSTIKRTKPAQVNSGFFDMIFEYPLPPK